MRALRGLMVLGSAAGLGGHAAAQVVSAVPEVPVAAPPFKERIDPNILSAGGLVVGLVSGDMKRPVSQSTITLSGIVPTDKYICVSMQHVAGAYSGGFAVPNPRRGHTVAFRIPTRLIAGLKAQTAGLAILAKAGSDARCTDKDAAVLPAAWGRVAPGTTAFALVNNHQADATLARIDNGTLKRCAPIGQMLGSKLAFRSYQVACEVNVAGSCAASAKLVVKFIDGASVSEIRPSIRRPC